MKKSGNIEESSPSENSHQSERRESERQLLKWERLAKLNSDVTLALIRSDSLQNSLRSCTESIVKHLDAAFARIWIFSEEENTLVLQASSGMYTHLDGQHARVPVGKFKIGLIAATRQPHLTNRVVGDPQVNDQEWAKREGMISFAGYPLIAEEKLFGVMAMFARQPLDEQVLEAMALVANIIALGIENKQAEEKLRESERRFRNLADHAPVMIWVTEPDATYSYLSQSWYEFTGQTPETGLEFGWIEAIHADDRQHSHDVFVAANERREPFRLEYRLRRADGSYAWAIDSAAPRFSDKGEYLGYVGSVVDITEQKRTQDALISAERRAAEDYEKLLSRIVPLAETLGTAREPTVIYRSIGEFVRASVPCAGYFVSFYDPKKRLRTAAYAWSEGSEIDVTSIPPIPIGKSGGPNTRAIRTGKTVVVDRYMELMKNRPHVVIGDDGKNPNSSLVVPMIVMGRVIGTIEVQAHEYAAYTREHIVALEMAANLAAVAIENVWLLESETALRREAEAVNRAKDEFLAVLSHELRTPLNAMLGWATLLKNNTITGEEARHAVIVIERNVRVQNTLIEDLLDVSRIITGKMRIEPEKIDFNGIVETAIETARLVAEKKQIEIETVFAAATSEINGDSHRLQQVVGNLLSNAIKFTPENGKIRVELAHAGDMARLVVSDTGIGIESDLLPQIFDRFRQADSSTTRNYGGLGLGLAIVNSLVEMHGGRVYAESEGVGKGSSFTIEIPLVVPSVFSDPLRQLNAEADVTAAANGNTDNKLLNGLRILVVDDDASALEMIGFVLAGQGAIVTTAQSANEALAKLDQAAPDVLVSDIGMSGMDGFDLIEQVRASQTAQKPFLPAIALTAYASPEDRMRALRAGFQIHIPKPIDVVQLPLAVARLAGRNQHQD